MRLTHQVQGTEYKVRPRLEGAWIEVFRAGDYADRGRWSERDLDQIAASYNPRLHAAPIVLGHPTHDAPACAWVKTLRRAGAALWAQLEQVDPAFEQLLRAGRFRSRSVALYTQFPPTGGPYLRHVGFLGAQAPAVKALSPVRFVESPTLTVEFHRDPCPVTRDPLEQSHRTRVADHGSRPSEDSMPESKSKLESFLDHLRAFFLPEPDPSPGRARACPLPSGSAEPEVRFAERIAQLEQRLDRLGEEKRATEQKLAERDLTQRRQQIETFVETLRGRGKFPPVFERLGVRAFLERLAVADSLTVIPSEARDLIGEKQIPRPDLIGTRNDTGAGESRSEVDAPPTEPTLLAWFQDFLTRLPAIINFSELAADTSHGSRATSHEKLVRFSEPRPGRGLAIDPASVELAERAQVLAAELGLSYGEALARLREEQRGAQSTA
ncbi:MAG: hypothetical protein ACE5MH_01935 [Terriglobia bacterium]